MLEGGVVHLAQAVAGLGGQPRPGSAIVLCQVPLGHHRPPRDVGEALDLLINGRLHGAAHEGGDGGLGTPHRVRPNFVERETFGKGAHLAEELLDHHQGLLVGLRPLWVGLLHVINHRGLLNAQAALRLCHHSS